VTRRTAVAAALLAAALVAAGCGSPDQQREPETRPTDTPSTSTSPTPEDSPTTRPPREPRRPGPPSTDGTLRSAAYGPGSEPPPWLFRRALPETADGYGVVRPTPPTLVRRAFTLPDTVRMLPGRGYASRLVSPAPGAVVDRSTWEPGCPVDRDELAWLRVVFLGFDDERHTGEVLVNAAVADDVDLVFRRLWQARFPMEQVLIVRTIDEEAPPTGDGNGTGGFVCRATTGGSSFSQHAYGLAVDVNTFQNPYRSGEVVLPERASSYLDRGRVRPGMITPDGPVVAAFAEIGWEWGGAWRTLEDYQHFSANGR
jgi:D-alanyl-D-alanine carboxypeptidase